MRPRGLYGDIAQALLAAAIAPGSVRDLAYRAQVGLPIARTTASRLVARGELVVLDASRPAMLARAAAGALGDEDLAPLIPAQQLACTAAAWCEWARMA